MLQRGTLFYPTIHEKHKVSVYMTRVWCRGSEAARRAVGAQEGCVRRVVDVDGLAARRQDADPRRPFQEQRRRLFALEDGDQGLHIWLKPVCARCGRSLSAAFRASVSA